MSDPRDQALEFALAQRPERIGVGRLCQELLADYLDEQITAATPSMDELRIYQPPKARNPYGRKGRPVTVVV